MAGRSLGLGHARRRPPPRRRQAAGARRRRPRRRRPTFKSGLDLVVVNVVVRDKDGKLVRGLTRDDFVVLEDGKPQTVTSFDFEEIENASLPSMETPTVLGAIAQPAAPAAARRAGLGRGAAGRRHEGPAADRALLRPRSDAARGGGARRAVGARLRREEDGPGRHPRGRVAHDVAHDRPGLHGGPAGAAGRAQPPQPGRRVDRGRRPPTRRSRRTPATRSSRTTPSSTSSTPIAGSTPCARSPTCSRASSRRSRSSTSAAA